LLSPQWHTLNVLTFSKRNQVNKIFMVLFDNRTKHWPIF